MFIEEANLIEVTVHYRKIGRSYVAYSHDKFIQAKLEPSLKNMYKTVKVKMKPLTWKAYNELQEMALIADENGEKKFNFRIYKENRLKELIIAWDAVTTNANGENIPVPVTEENILKLSPDIAEAILEGYDAAALMSDEEEKK